MLETISPDINKINRDIPANIRLLLVQRARKENREPFFRRYPFAYWEVARSEEIGKLIADQFLLETELSLSGDMCSETSLNYPYSRELYDERKNGLPREELLALTKRNNSVLENAPDCEWDLLFPEKNNIE
jgi:hypothetical protein